MTTASNTRSSTATRVEDQGWGSRLTVCAAASIGFLSVSGLVIWLVPFGLLAQTTVLLHTVVGIAVVVPTVWYGLRHWWVYRRHPLTYLKTLGYFAVFVFAACMASGFVVTYQSLFGRVPIRCGERCTAGRRSRSSR